jgi:hypothetical protein
MVLKSVGSRLFKVNLLADHILGLIPSEEHTKIQIVDCDNFVVIKGNTTHKEPLNLSEAIDGFNSKYSIFLGENFIKNTIELMEYDVKLTKKEDLKYSFYNSENCSYTYKQCDQYNLDKSFSYDVKLNKINDETNLVVSSDFPYGYSLDQGRILYYYGKHITYNIPPRSPFTELVLELSYDKKDEDLFFNVYDTLSEDYDEKLKSSILDTFDFDYSVLKKEIKKVDWSKELTDPLNDFECLKKIQKDFLVI